MVATALNRGLRGGLTLVRLLWVGSRAVLALPWEEELVDEVLGL